MCYCTSLFNLLKDETLSALYEGYPENKLCLRILPLQRCGHEGAHACPVCWFCDKAWTQFADIRTVFYAPCCVFIGLMFKKIENPAARKNLITTFGWEQFNHPPYSPDLAPGDCHLFLHLLNPSLLARGSTTTRSKKLLPRALNLRRHHSAMKGYKNWCNAMTSASTMLVTMSKSSVRCVHQMAIYMVCNIFFFIRNSGSELTFWITLV